MPALGSMPSNEGIKLFAEGRTKDSIGVPIRLRSTAEKKKKHHEKYFRRIWKSREGRKGRQQLSWL